MHFMLQLLLKFTQLVCYHERIPTVIKNLFSKEFGEKERF